MFTYGLIVHIAGFFSTSLSAAVQLKLSRFHKLFPMPPCNNTCHVSQMENNLTHTRFIDLLLLYGCIPSRICIYDGLGENSCGHVNKHENFPGRVLLIYGSSLHAGELLMILLFSAKERG